MCGFYLSADKFFLYWFIHFLLAENSTSMGSFIGSMTDDLARAQGLASPLMVVLFLFGGVYINIEDIPAYISWLRYFSYFYYANEVITINQWKDASYNCDICGEIYSKKDCEELYDLDFEYTRILQIRGFDESHKSLYIGLLVIL